MNEALSAGPGNDTQQGYNYSAAMLEANASGDPIERQIMAANGIQQVDPVTKDIPYAQLDQLLNTGPAHGSDSRPIGRNARGGSVKSPLEQILSASPMHKQAPEHYDDGGYVQYDPEMLGYPINQQYSPPTPDYSQFTLPTDQQGLQQSLYSNDPTGQSSNPISGYGIPAYLQNPSGGGSGGINIAGLAKSGLSGLLSNPSLLGALLGGGMGLAGALGSNNGQNTMTANFKPTPPQMFQGSGPSPNNMYGNFSAAPRQRLNPTNINYAHAGEQPTSGGNLFYSPSGGGPTAQPSQQSPLQQYGAQMVQPAPQQPQPQQQTIQQLLQQLTANQGMPSYGGIQGMPLIRAKGGPAEGGGSPQMGPLSRHMVPATKGGPSYIQGPGDGTSDDIDARLSNGEYVMTAQDVALLGNGSNEAGAKKLDELRANLRKHAGEKLIKGEQFMKAKQPLSYLKGPK